MVCGVCVVCVRTQNDKLNRKNEVGDEEYNIGTIEDSVETRWED